MNKKVIILICLMLLITLSYFIFITKFISFKKPKVEDFKSQNEIIENNPENLNNIEKDNVIDFGEVNNEENITYNNNGSNRVATSSILDVIERTARKHIANFNFSTAEDSITSSIADYDISNSPDFDNLKDMYFDLPVMIQFEHLKSYNENNQLIQLINGLRDSENYFVSVMWLDRKERENFIYMNDSVNPVFAGELEVLNKNRIVDFNIEELDGLSKRFSNIEYVDEIEFEIEGNVLIAYIAKVNGKFMFFRMIEKFEDTTIYYTIKEWNELQNEIKGNLSPLKESKESKDLNFKNDTFIDNLDEEIEKQKEDD